jgi:ribosomal protein S19
MYKKLNFRYFIIFDEDGKKIQLKKQFRNIPFFSKNILRYLKKFNDIDNTKIIKIFNTSVICFSFFKNKNIFIYNGKKLILFYYKSIKLFKLIGEFINTRVINSGKILHQRKKNLKQIKKK